MAKKRAGGLGRGLDALFSESDLTKEVSVEKNASGVETKNQQGIVYVGINEIQPNRSQPRKKLDEEKIRELAESIREHGLIQPIIVRPVETGGFELVAGERRWRASRVAGMEQIPCIIRELSDRENMLIAIIENTQREDLDPIEEATAFQEMIGKYKLTQIEVSKSVGKSRPYVTNALRLLGLPEQVQKMVSTGEISSGHARALAGIGDPEIQIRTAKEIQKSGMSVRTLEEKIAKIQTDDGKQKKRQKQKNPEVMSVENELQEILGTKVSISDGRDRGTITISYFSKEELDRLIETLQSLQ